MPTIDHYPPGALSTALYRASMEAPWAISETPLDYTGHRFVEDARATRIVQAVRRWLRKHDINNRYLQDLVILLNSHNRLMVAELLSALAGAVEPGEPKVMGMPVVLDQTLGDGEFRIVVTRRDRRDS